MQPFLGDILLDDNLDLVKDVVYAARFHRLSKCREFFVAEKFAGVARKLYLLPDARCKSDEEVVTRLVEEYSRNVVRAFGGDGASMNIPRLSIPSGAFDTIGDLEVLRDVTIDAGKKLVHFDLASAVTAGASGLGLGSASDPNRMEVDGEGGGGSGAAKTNKVNGYSYTKVMYGAGQP